MKPTGMNTDARISAMLTTGPDTSSIALQRGVPRRHPLFDVVLHRLHDDDRIVDDQADGEHEAEQRQRVDRRSRAAGKTANVPMSDTGTAIIGMSVARQFWRNR